MRKPILVIQHEKNEDPGYITDWAQENRIPLKIINPQTSLLPKSNFSGVILLGGMMNICDQKELPWLTDEIEWAKIQIHQPIPILGICLGAQILAHALGANIHPLAHEEMGWQSIRSTPGWNISIKKVFQAHSYYFEIPSGAQCLAESDLCPHQAFSLDKRILGLQFHLEWPQQKIAELFPDFYKCHGSPIHNHIASRTVLFSLLNKHFENIT